MYIYIYIYIYIYKVNNNCKYPNSKYDIYQSIFMFKSNL